MKSRKYTVEREGVTGGKKFERTSSDRFVVISLKVLKEQVREVVTAYDAGEKWLDKAGQIVERDERVPWDAENEYFHDLVNEVIAELIRRAKR